MAFRPSMRSHNKVKEIPLDIRPVMNLMVVLIPILLYSAEFVKLAIRELNLPPAAAAGEGQTETEPKQKEKEKRLGLTLLLAEDGIYVANSAGFLPGEEAAAEQSDAPTVAATEDDSYDFDLLQEKLIEIKKEIDGKGFLDDKSIIISASANIEYKHIIKVIDYATIYEDDEGNQQELFPQINIGQVR